MTNLILIETLAIAIIMTSTWFWFKATKNPGVVDVVWSPTIVILSMIYYIFHKTYYNIYLILLILWSGRLTLFLWKTRINKNFIEKRYFELQKKWSNKSFLIHYFFQGILCILSSSCFYFHAQKTQSNTSDYFFYVLILFCIIIEAFCDITLHNHKKTNPDSICKKGLWKYSRHPNYFFELSMWFLLSLSAVVSSYNGLAFISFITTYWIIVKVTCPISEKTSLKNKNKYYQEYIDSTPQYLPNLKALIKNLKK